MNLNFYQVSHHRSLNPNAFFSHSWYPNPHYIPNRNLKNMEQKLFWMWYDTVCIFQDIFFFPRIKFSRREEPSTYYCVCIYHWYIQVNKIPKMILKSRFFFSNLYLGCPFFYQNFIGMNLQSSWNWFVYVVSNHIK